jgi:hypothetical protein
MEQIYEARSPSVIAGLDFFEKSGANALTKREVIRHLQSLGFADAAYVPAYLLRIGEVEPVEIAEEVFYVRKGFERDAVRLVETTSPDETSVDLYRFFGMSMPAKMIRSVCHSPLGMRKGKGSAHVEE